MYCSQTKSQDCQKPTNRELTSHNKTRMWNAVAQDRVPCRRDRKLDATRNTTWKYNDTAHAQQRFTVVVSGGVGGGHVVFVVAVVSGGVFWFCKKHQICEALYHSGTHFEKKRTLHPTMNHAMAYGGVPVFWFGFNPSGFRQFFFRLLPAALCLPRIKKRKHTGSKKQNKKLVDKNCLTLPYRTYNTIHYTCQARIVLLPNACRPLTRPSTAASTAASTSFSTGSSIQAKRCPATKPR